MGTTDGGALKMYTMVQNQQIDSELLRIKFRIMQSTLEKQMFMAAQSLLKNDSAALKVLEQKILDITEVVNATNRQIEILKTRKEMNGQLQQYAEQSYSSGVQKLGAA
jgi:hypothetical protein